MKRFAVCLCTLAWMLAVVTSCDDDSEGSVKHELFLAEVARNGVTTLKLFYDNQRLLTRANTYTDGELFNYILYEYNDTGIEEARRYNGDDHSLSLKAEFSLDNFGRATQVEFSTAPSNFEKVAGVFMFSYEGSGQLKSRQFYIPPASTPAYRDEYTYDPAGSRIGTKRIIDPGLPKEYVSYEILYTSSEQMIPEHWNDTVFLLTVTNYDDSIREMFAIGTHRTSQDSDEEQGTESRTEATEQIFNADGYLTSQVLTRIYVSSGEPDAVTALTYEYTK